MSQVLFPKLATSNVFQKIAKSLLKFAIGTFPKVITNTVFQKLSQALIKFRLREQLETSQGEVQRLDHRVTELATQVTRPYLILCISDSRPPAPIPPTLTDSLYLLFSRWSCPRTRASKPSLRCWRREESFRSWPSSTRTWKTTSELLSGERLESSSKWTSEGQI